jgi:protein O-mannosyl-transferase
MRAELVALGEKHPGSWLEYIERDVVDNGEEHDGVDPKYRPRGYNQGPKE